MTKPIAHIMVIGAGVTGVTVTYYALRRRVYEATLIDRLRYPAMETSFANGGLLSAATSEIAANHIDAWNGAAR
jgi:D-amino-acid dehydrogenase